MSGLSSASISTRAEMGYHCHNWAMAMTNWPRLEPSGLTWAIMSEIMIDLLLMLKGISRAILCQIQPAVGPLPKSEHTSSRIKLTLQRVFSMDVRRTASDACMFSETIIDTRVSRWLSVTRYQRLAVTICMEKYFSGCQILSRFSRKVTMQYRLVPTGSDKPVGVQQNCSFLANAT